MLRLRAQATLIGFHMGIEDQHPDPHALSGSILPTALALLCWVSYGLSLMWDLKGIIYNETMGFYLSAHDLNVWWALVLGHPSGQTCGWLANIHQDEHFTWHRGWGPASDSVLLFQKLSCQLTKQDLSQERISENMSSRRLIGMQTVYI